MTTEEKAKAYDDTTLKVEPKFKVGDWVVDKNGIVKKILSYNNGVYKHTYGYSAKIFEDEWRLWDITKDAKDGDVLVYGEQLFLFKRVNTSNSFCAHCNYHFIGYNSLCVYDCSYSIDNIYPATKEQRDLLFQKMKEAGYEWSEEFKEIRKTPTPADVGFAGLGKIWEKEANAIAEKQKWSEEDEHLRQKAIDFIKHPDLIKATPTLAKNTIDWLKSLKEKVQLQNSSVTDEELAQAKKDAYNDALDKLEYNSGNPTFDDGWSAAIWYLKKRNVQFKNA